jgi:putative transcriptional regulator
MARDDRQRLTNQVRRLRFDHGEMTQAELGKKVGVTRQTIIALEAGGYVPSLALAFRIARAFGRSVEEVFQYRQDSG